MGSVSPEPLGVVIVAAGTGTRFGDADKVFAPLAGLPVIEHSLNVFMSFSCVSQIVLVMGAHTFDRGRELADRLGSRVSVAAGGSTRSESVRAGIGALEAGVRLVAVHDAARPLLTSDMFQRLIDASRLTGAAVPTVPVVDTVYGVDSEGVLERVVDRSSLRAAQTPQIARRDWLECVLADAETATDEGTLLHSAGYPVALVAGDAENIKITVPHDLIVADAIVAARQGSF